MTVEGEQRTGGNKIQISLQGIVQFAIFLYISGPLSYGKKLNARKINVIQIYSRHEALLAPVRDHRPE